MSSKPIKTQKTYFGLASLVVSILSILFLAFDFYISQLDVPPQVFSFWNEIVLAISCLAAPLAIGLAVTGYRKPKDSQPVSIISIILVSLPFAVLFVQFILSFTR